MHQPGRLQQEQLPLHATITLLPHQEVWLPAVACRVSSSKHAQTHLQQTSFGHVPNDGSLLLGMLHAKGAVLPWPFSYQPVGCRRLQDFDWRPLTTLLRAVTSSAPRHLQRSLLWAYESRGAQAWPRQPGPQVFTCS